MTDEKRTDRERAEELIEFSAGFFGSEKVINHFRSMIETALRQVADDARKEERSFLEDLMFTERQKLGAVDGYGYSQGVHDGIDKAIIAIRNRSKQD